MAPPGGGTPLPFFEFFLRVQAIGNGPAHQRCLEGAPAELRKIPRSDISRADFTWCMTALTCAWRIKETAIKLMELRGKARDNGEMYARRAAQNIASGRRVPPALRAPLNLAPPALLRP
jgi:hypothetical protein